MEALQIARFQAQYHLAPAQAGEKERLDRLLAEMLDGSLALALERLGIPPREEICIRRIQAPVRLRMAANDSDLVLDWSLGLAEAFRTVIANNDPANVVRYPSRFHGLVDFADGVARGDLQRAWAWHQLGFSVPSRLDSLVEAAEGLVTSLMNEPAWIVPILSRLSDNGAIDSLLGRLPVVWWQDLARAALTAHGVATPVPDLGAGHGAIGNRQGVAARIVRASSLASVVDRQPAWFSNQVELLSGWSIFVILEAEPAVFLGGTQEAAQVQAGVQAALGRKIGMAEPVSPVFSEAAGETEAKNLAGAGKTPETSRGVGNPAFTDGTGGSPGKKLPNTPQALLDRQNVTGAGKRHSGAIGLDESGLRTPDEEPAKITAIGSEPAAVPDPSPLVRSQGYSEYGGLLFLVLLLEQAGVVDAIVRAEQFGRRSLRWFLHGLALHLLPIPANDPAALAFCGLRPDDPVPGRDEPGPDETEKRLLAEWRRTIVEQLAGLMNRNHWQMEPERILHRVCCRNARIIADPGWFEVIFSIREVVTEVRRAGLDLDPGFVPWLGVVIKFHYE
ncbi:MAG: hypothetical protein AB7E77_10200 [Desulfobulbus sp.]